MMEINFIFTFRLQQYHGDDGNNFIFTFRLHQYHGDDGNEFYIYIQITTIPQRWWKSILYLHLNYHNTAKTKENNFIFTFKLQQYHGDDGNQFIFTFRLQQYHEDDGNQFVIIFRLQQYHVDDRNQFYTYI